MMEISASLHNSLVILICIILLVLIFFIGLKQCRRLWRQIHMIYNGQRNVVALDSAEVHDLIDTLCTVNDTIPIHPRQIRRILRKLLDANVVKEIACSQPTLHLKQPHFYKHDERKQYIVKLNAHQRAPPSSLLLPVLNNNSNVLNNSGSSPQRIFDFYFGVPKHYYFQLKSITKSCQKSAIFQREQKKQIYQAVPTQSFMHQSHASLASTSQVQRTMMTSPLESIIGFAATRVQPAIQRMHSSSSLGSKSEMDDVDIIMDVEKRRRVSGADAASGAAVDEGIEMAEIVRIPQTQTQTQTQNAKATSLSMMSMMSLSSTMSLLPQSSQLTLQRLIPNQFVLRERIECKDDEEQLSFDERDLESTINAIIAIGNNGGHRSRNVLQKKHGPPTKYKRHRSSADVAAATGRARDRDEKTQEEDEDDTSVDGNAFYFCALLSYVRYPITEQQQQEQKEDEDAAEQKHMHMDDEEEEEEEKKVVVEEQDEEEEEDGDRGQRPNLAKALMENETTYDVIEENGRKYRIDDIEIALFDPPSALSKTNQIQSEKQKKSDKDKKNSRAKTHNVSIATALDPALNMQLLCDFKLQRLVEYYDIFGISDVDLNDADSSLECKICFSFPSNVVLIPCRHCCCCETCFHQIEHCPLCRTPIRQTLRWTSD